MIINFKSQSWLMLYSYLIANGFLYSFLFWQGFDINILQYVSPYDLLPSILFILIIPTVIVILYCGLMAMIIPYNERVERFFHRKNSKAYRIFTLLFTVLLRISFALYTLYSLFFKSGFDRQLSFVIIFAFIVLWPLQKKTTLFSDKGKFRDLYIAAVIMLPLIVYMVAHYKVETIKTGLNSYIVTSDSDCVKVNNERFRYISSIGDKAFAYSLEDGSLCVFKYNYLHLIDENKKIQADLEALNAHTS